MALSLLSRTGRRLIQQPVLLHARNVCSTSPVFNAEAVQEDKNSTGTRGWGTTRIGDLLRAKGNDSGAWLWCTPQDMVIEAVRKMTKGNVGSLLVFDPSKISADGLHNEDAVLGIITERDYLTKMVVQGKSSLSTKVEEIMTPGKKLVTASPNDTVADVMEDMCDKNIRHVPVVNKEGTMVGMVSMRDVVNVVVKEHREEVGQLQEYISGSY